MKITLLAAILMIASVFSFHAQAAELDPAKQQQMLQKIEELERQINELKSLKMKKETLPVKKDQCMKVVGVETYCNCIVDSLPVMVDYRQFVQILLTPANEFGYDKMTSEQKRDVDKALVVWARCVDYKGPKGQGIIDGLMKRETLF